MAKKLSLRERAKIRLGDYSASEADIQKMMKKIEAEDAEIAADVPRQKKSAAKKKDQPRYEWRGEDLRHTVAEMQFSGLFGDLSDSLLRAVAERDGVSVEKVVSDLHGKPDREDACSVPVDDVVAVPAPQKKRGGYRGGHRPKTLPDGAFRRSIWATAEEFDRIKELLAELRKKAP